MTYTTEHLNKTATTNHGERVRVIGAAHDPARVCVQPIDSDGNLKVGVEWFTPRIANLRFDSEPLTDAHLAEARAMGVEAAEAAASWTVDGNTPREHIARMVAWMDDGDPRVDDYLPAWPTLSGEWADSPTPTSLWGDVVGYNAAGGIDDGNNGEDLAALCDAWEEGVSDTFMPACEAELRRALN